MQGRNAASQGLPAILVWSCCRQFKTSPKMIFFLSEFFSPACFTFSLSLSFEVNGVNAKPFEPRDIVLVLDVLLFIFVKETCKGFVLCQWRKSCCPRFIYKHIFIGFLLY